MKNILTISILSILIVSCGQTSKQTVDAIVAESNPATLKSKRNELKKVQGKVLFTSSLILGILGAAQSI